MVDSPKSPSDIAINLVVAMTRSGVIGHQGCLPWPAQQVPGEQTYFKTLTLGRSVVMGRKTWDSLPPAARPLRQRDNYILTRNPTWQPRVVDRPRDRTTWTGVNDRAQLWDQLRDRGCNQVFVIGGAEIYDLFYDQADRIYLSLIETEYPGDTRFPRDVLNDRNWDWQPGRLKWPGWTWHILCRSSVCSQRQETPHASSQ